MRPLLIALAAVALAPACASAAPFGELPFQTIPGGATCLRATGAPAELVAWAPDGARFLRATPSGLAPASSARLGAPQSCPAATVKPNGAGVVAAPVGDGLSVAVREPGGAWGQATKLALPADVAVTDLATAVSPRGDAVVIWIELKFQRRGAFTRMRVAKRSAGGAFGAPQTLTISELPPFSSNVAAGMADDGTAIIAFSHETGSERAIRSVLDAAIAPPGAPFGAGQRLSTSIFGEVRLAVGDDGGALLAFGADVGVRIAERAPGGGFGPAYTLGAGGGSELTLALGSGGDALVAWGSGLVGDVTYARRTDASGFGPPIELRPASIGNEGVFLQGSGNFLTGGAGTSPGRPGDEGGTALRAALAPGGRAVFSWGGRRSRAGIGWTAAHVATLSSDDSVATQTLGGPLRDADSIAPIVLENGVPAVAWGDNGDADGRAHLAIEGVTDPPRPALQVRVGAPADTSLRRTQPLVLPVTCSAACDVRAEVRGLPASASLTRAGTVRLQFLGEKSPARLRAARVPIAVLAGPPGARDVPTRVVRPRLRRIPDPPMPRILDLAVVRNGSDVDVSWRVDRSARDVGFVVYTSATRELREEPGAPEFVRGSSKRAYRVQLHHVSSKARYVLLEASRGGRTRHARVRLR